jgi:hypothetical protein
MMKESNRTKPERRDRVISRERERESEERSLSAKAKNKWEYNRPSEQRRRIFNRQ